ncbi:hypothetical protein ABTX60_41195 [Streptomyces sp. NPDC126510]|uniref:hypothetical protein n=1 Tax=Streptomyces sp. NPDC126510 TaxID=3155317 RepID=UPI00331A952C
MNVQKEQRERVRDAGFNLCDLSRITMSPSEETTVEQRAGWATGEENAAWRPYNQEVYWSAFATHRRAMLTHEDTTYADWVCAWVDLRAMCASREAFNRFWLYEVEPAYMPRNWLRWAADTVQEDTKSTDGNPIDAPHASYLPDCDVFLTADRTSCGCWTASRSRPRPPWDGPIERLQRPTTASWRRLRPRCAPSEPLGP